MYLAMFTCNSEGIFLVPFRQLSMFMLYCKFLSLHLLILAASPFSKCLTFELLDSVSDYLSLLPISSSVLGIPYPSLCKECLSHHCLTFQVLNFLAEKPVIVQIWGKQKADCKKPVNRAAREGQSTKDIMAARILKKGFLVQQHVNKVYYNSLLSQPIYSCT